MNRWGWLTWGTYGVFRVFIKSSKHRMIAFMVASGSRKLTSVTCSPGFKALCEFTGFPGGLDSRVCLQCGRSLGWEDTLAKEMAIHSCIFAGKSHEWRSLAVYSPWVTRSWTRLSNFTAAVNFIQGMVETCLGQLILEEIWKRGRDLWSEFPSPAPPSRDGRQGCLQAAKVQTEISGH